MHLLGLLRVNGPKTRVYLFKIRVHLLGSKGPKIRVYLFKIRVYLFGLLRVNGQNIRVYLLKYRSTSNFEKVTLILIHLPLAIQKGTL